MLNNKTRNIILLAGSLAALYAMGQLVLAVAAVTMVEITGINAIAGFGPAIFMFSGSIAALVSGRLMDRYGRVPVLCAGYAIGIIGALMIAVAVGQRLALPLLLGFLVLGCAFGTGILARVAAADMYPPEKRAWGMSLVLFGAVFGAMLGPMVFAPMYAGANSDLPVSPWYAAAGLMLIAMVLVSFVRKTDSLGDETEPAVASVEKLAPTPTRNIVARPGVSLALIVSIVSFSVMVAMMNMVGLVMVQHGHSQASVFPILSAHVFGMFAFVILVGKFAGKFGNKVAMIVGLLILGLSSIATIYTGSQIFTMAALFGVGLGWNFAYVGANAELSSLTEEHERGGLLGLSDLLSGTAGAIVTVICGVVVTLSGQLPLAVIGLIASILPIRALLRARARSAF